MTRHGKPRAQDLADFAGQWVAFSKNRVIAAGASLPDIMEKVRTKRLRSTPTVFLVPRDDEGPYVLLGWPRGC